MGLGLWNVLTPADRPFPGLLIVLPLIAAARCRPSTTAWFGALAFGATLALTLRQSPAIRSDQLIRLLTILAAAGLSVLLSLTRARAERSLRAVFEISEAAHAAPDLDALYRAVHRIVGELMHAHNFYVALLEPGDSLSFPYWISEKEPRPETGPLQEGLTEQVIATGQLLHRASPSVDWLGAPLILGERTIGALVVQSYTLGVRFRREDERVLEYVAERVARAIERKQSEEALHTNQERFRQAQKMEAVGRLAGGVAHDFNNLLTIIFGELDLAEEELPPAGPVREAVDSVRRAAESAAALTRQLLAFSRRTVVVPSLIDLNELVANAERMLRRVIGEDIVLVVKPAADLGTTLADPGSVEQVVLNLAVNARDAMPTGGTLTLETLNTSLDAAYVQTRPGASVGDFVVIVLTDTGTGIPPEVMPHIFEPFFTTKPEGQGTGLGLATCYGIVKQAGGYIGVYSEPGMGTTFRIYLPRTAGMTGDAATALPDAPQGSETILVVEDSPAVRAVAAKALRALGYLVVEAADGFDALGILATTAQQVEAVVTDVVMPGMGGRELADKVKVLRPGTRVLFCSGYTDDVVIRQRLLDHGTAFLQKPYTALGLARKLRELLDAKRA